MGPHKLVLWALLSSEKINKYIVFQKRRKSLKKLLEPGHRERDAELVADIVKRVNAIQEQLDRQLDKSLGNKENCPIIDTAEKTTANKQVSLSTSL